MADKKISALTAASTPLVGTEVLPIVQSGATVKVSVDNLTTGKAVTVGSMSSSGLITARAGVVGGNFSAVQVDNQSGGSGSPANTVSVNFANGGAVKASITAAVYGDGYMDFATDSNTAKMRITAGGGIINNLGNFVLGTAGRGIDFSANGGDVLSQYDEGTWNVVWTNLTGTPSNTTGYYTRVGRMVFFTYAAGATSISGVGDVAKFSLPFTPGAYASGSMISQTNTNAGSILIDTGAVVYPATFSGSYMVFSGVFYI